MYINANVPNSKINEKTIHSLRGVQERLAEIIMPVGIKVIRKPSMKSPMNTGNIPIMIMLELK